MNCTRYEVTHCEAFSTPHSQLILAQIVASVFYIAVVLCVKILELLLLTVLTGLFTCDLSTCLRRVSHRRAKKRNPAVDNHCQMSGGTDLICRKGTPFKVMTGRTACSPS